MKTWLKTFCESRPVVASRPGTAEGSPDRERRFAETPLHPVPGRDSRAEALVGFLSNAARKSLFTVTTAALFATAGCGLLTPEEDGDQPPTLAEYRVSITPSLVTVDGNNTNLITIDIGLSATCAGDNLPVCASHDPEWVVSIQEEIGVNKLSVAVVDPHKPNTMATIRLNPESLTHLVRNRRSERFIGVQFTPKPPNRLTLTGRSRVDLLVLFPPPGGERQETTAEEPRLTAFPNSVELTSLLQQPTVKPVTVIYSGPPTDILGIALGGPDAAKFNLARPPLPVAVDGSFAFSFDITFLGATNTAIYSATATIFTQNGATKTVRISAHH